MDLGKGKLENCGVGLGFVKFKDEIFGGLMVQN